MNSHYISLLKALTWRVLGSVSTFIISWTLTKRIDISIGIASIEFFGKIGLYYIHERIWHKITKK
jgi:uncharacterized membrane protein